MKIFALLGCPVEHTLSPYMHNAAFLKLKMNAVYIPLSVEAKDLKRTIAILKSADISGFNVTIPFKSACMKYLDRIDRLASMIGAVNTVVITNRKLTGYNTDAPGFLKSAREKLGFNPKNKSCFIVGAGGAARAACFALAMKGAREIFITDVIKSKAVSLAKNIRNYFPKCNAEAIDKFEIRNSKFEFDILVNATPLGMKKTDPLPINAKFLRKGLKIYDLVYNPSPTKLVKKAKQKGIRAVNGLGMLLYQGAEAFELWTNKKAPVEVMKKALPEYT